MTSRGMTQNRTILRRRPPQVNLPGVYSLYILLQTTVGKLHVVRSLGVVAVTGLLVAELVAGGVITDGPVEGVLGLTGLVRLDGLTRITLRTKDISSVLDKPTCARPRVMAVKWPLNAFHCCYGCHSPWPEVVGTRRIRRIRSCQRQQWPPDPAG